MSRLLTDEETYRCTTGGKPGFISIAEVKIAQDAKTDPLVRADERSQMAEWLNEPCDNGMHSEDDIVQVAHRECPDCMDELSDVGMYGRAPWA
jgi:hypothetical protein